MNNIYKNIVENYNRKYKSLSQKNRRYYEANGVFNKAYLDKMNMIMANKELAKQKIVVTPSKSRLIKMNKDYGNELMKMGFNQHNVYRNKQRTYSSDTTYRNELYTRNHNTKTTSTELDWYMNNLLKRNDIDLIWACIEPDIDKITNEVDKYSNNVHFSFRVKQNSLLSKYQLANYMNVDRHKILETKPIENSMAYFTKHLGKSLSYHNLYMKN